MNKTVRRIALMACLTLAGLGTAHKTNAAGEILYHFEALAGTGVCLDVVNDADKDKVTAAKCGRYTGQAWRIDPADLREGSMRLRSSFTGEGKCLDIVNDAQKNKVVMARCGNYTGQMWQISLAGPDGLAQLRNKFSGPTSCLQLFEGGDRYATVRMAPCSDSEAQQWRPGLMR